jgi:hypothetical protein
VVLLLPLRLAHGSWLAISHAAEGGIDANLAQATADVYQRKSLPVGMRSRDQIAWFFAGFTMIEPGLVWLPQWRPQPGDPADFIGEPHRSGAVAGVAFK